MTIVYASADGWGTIAQNGENTAAFIAETVGLVAILIQHPFPKIDAYVKIN